MIVHTIAEAWSTVVARILDPNLTEEGREERRRVFYLGAASGLACVKSDETEEGFKRLKNELKQFADDLDTREKKKKPLTMSAHREET